MIAWPTRWMRMVFSSHKCNDYLLNNITAAGGKTLQDLVKEYREEYRTLSTEEKERLVEELYKFKVLKAVGVRTTAKSKINDVTNTLKAVETEACFLLLFQMFITTIFLALQSQRSYWRRKYTICSLRDNESSASGNCLRN